MRLHLLLPKVDPKAIPVPSQCAYADCTSLQVRLHQPVQKALRDTVHRQVEVHRYRCLKCGRTLRVYPPGVSHATSVQIGSKGSPCCCICWDSAMEQCH
jgi:hypothetical protein